MKRSDRAIKGSSSSNRMAEMRERAKARMAFKGRDKRLGELAVFDGDGDDDPLLDEPATGVDGVNDAIRAIADAQAPKKGKSKNKLSGAELEKWKNNRARVQEIRERQADAGHYVVLCFPSGGVCQAFVDHLQRNYIVGREGDMFLDGRHVAAVFGIPLPGPEYAMTTSVALSKGETKRMKKVPKGYAAGDEGTDD